MKKKSYAVSKDDPIWGPLIEVWDNPSDDAWSDHIIKEMSLSSSSPTATKKRQK